MSALHPLPKLAICLLWLAASILVFDPLFQLGVIAVALIILIAIERRSPFMVMTMMIPFALFGFGFLTTSVLFGKESDFAARMAAETPWGGASVSAGIVLFLRAIACGMISAVFVLTTDPGQFLKALMVQGRLPPRMAFAVFSSLQLLPDLGREAHQIRLARAMKRGRPPSRIPGIGESASLLVPLLAFAIRRASRAAIAMEAKGLGASPNRTVVGATLLKPTDLIFSIAASGALAALIFAVTR